MHTIDRGKKDGGHWSASHYLSTIAGSLLGYFVGKDACFRKEGNRHGKMERHLQVCDFNFWD